MDLSERNLADLIDWRLGRIQNEKSFIKKMKKNAKKATKLNKPEIEQLCQRVIQAKERNIERLREEIQHLDPHSVIRIKLAKAYLNLLDQTKDE